MGALAIALAAAAPAAAQRAYVVTSDQPAFAEAAKAALEVLGGSASMLRADDSAKGQLAGAAVVVAVGPLAERVVGASLASDGRAVACLTPKVATLPDGRTVAVPLHPSHGDVLKLLKEMLPTARKLGVFPAAGGSEAALAAAAREAGFDVSFPKKGEVFAAAVDRLVGSADALWIEDTSSVPSGGAALVVKKASDGRKQVVGPNRATVLQGAFFAVVPDPVAQGRAAGDAAARLLRGETVDAVAPPNGRLVINGALSRTMALKLQPATARRAETVE